MRSDGTVVSRAIVRGDLSDSTSEFTFDEFLNQHSVSKVVVELFEGWPEHRPSTNQQYTEAVAKGHLLGCLAMLAKSTPAPKLRVQSKPARSVFAESNYNIGKLVLVPETSRISAIKPGACVPTGALEAKIEELPENDTTVDHRPSTPAYYLIPMLSSTFACAAWAVRTTDKEDEATVEITMRKMKVSTRLSPKVESTVTTEIPIIVNKRSMTAGEELLLYRAPVPKARPPKRDLTLKLEPPSKSAKA